MPAEHQSAASRCPVEIWFAILRMATYVPPTLYDGMHLDRFSQLYPAQLHNGQRVDHDQLEILQLVAACSTAWNCARVSRSWFDLCYPFVLEHVYVWRATRHVLPDHALSTVSFQGNNRGAFVKSLYMVNPDPPSDYSSFLVNITRLEEFVYVQNMDARGAAGRLSDTAAALIAFCSLTLICLDIRVNVDLPLHQIHKLVSACQQLKRLSVRAPDVQRFNLAKLIGPTDSPTLALESLSWAVDETRLPTTNSPFQSTFLRFLLCFKMPRLRHIAMIELGNLMRELGIFLDGPPRNPGKEYTFLDFLRRNGPQLRYVQFERRLHMSYSQDRVFSTILQSCTSLDTLDISLRRMEPFPASLGSVTLRKLLCSSFFPAGFALDPTPDERQSFAARVGEVLAPFFSGRFPALQVIQLRDVQRVTAASQTWPRKYDCAAPPEFVRLLKRLYDTCQRRGIRLEDGNGELVDRAAFSPVEAWFLAYHRLL